MGSRLLRPARDLKGVCNVWYLMAEPLVSRKLKATSFRARTSTRPSGSASRAYAGAAGAKMLEMEMMAQRVWQGGLLNGLSGSVAVGGVALVRTRSDVAERGGSGRPGRAAMAPPVTLRVSPHAINSLLPDHKPKDGKGGGAGGNTSPMSALLPSQANLTPPAVRTPLRK